MENDALSGDQDDIELSFQIYKNGQVQTNSVHAADDILDEEGSAVVDAERNLDHDSLAVSGPRSAESPH